MREEMWLESNAGKRKAKYLARGNVTFQVNFEFQFGFMEETKFLAIYISEDGSSKSYVNIRVRKSIKISGAMKKSYVVRSEIQM